MSANHNVSREEVPAQSGQSVRAEIIPPLGAPRYHATSKADYTNYAYAWHHGWRWVGWYLRRRKWLAAARQFWLAYVRGWDSEACQDCGRSYVSWWSTNDLFGRATERWPTPWNDGTDREQPASGLFCLACFDERASAKGIPVIWQPFDMNDPDWVHPAARPVGMTPTTDPEACRSRQEAP